jgi:hypothetical protein
MDILAVMNRIKALQEFEVKTTLPEDFRFKGRVPFDMHIVDNEATIKVLALDLEEAMMRVDSFLFEDDGEGDCR